MRPRRFSFRPAERKISVMVFNFTDLIDREGRDAVAVEVIPIPGAEVDEGVDRIPMWVADMNFATAPSVQKALAERIAHPCFGYFSPSDAWYDSIIRWHAVRHGVTGLSREHIDYENGVLGGVVSSLNTFCAKGDKVLLHSPTYVGFTGILKNNGYEAVHSPLKQDSGGVWRMDLEDMEEKLCAGDIRAAILCSPHNPAGRVWERRELEAAMALFEKYRVWVVSDEIWSDLIMPGHVHVPTQLVSDYARTHTVALYAVTKTFNLAGLVGAYHIIYDPVLRSRIRKEQSLSHYNGMNVLSMHALIGAYSDEGMAWTDELISVLDGNLRFACGFIAENFPGVRCTLPEGTYMLFLDCSGWCRDHGISLDDVLKAGVRAGVIWQDGRAFFGPCHIRMNLALPRSRVEEAFLRLKKSVFVS